MTEQEHNEIMTNIMKELDKESLNLGDGITIWHSLGVFLFSNLDKENKDAYIDLICNEMIPKAAKENLAEFIDVFCETGYFTVAQTEKILKAGK